MTRARARSTTACSSSHDDGTIDARRRLLPDERPVPLPAARHVSVLRRDRRRAACCCRATGTLWALDRGHRARRPATRGRCRTASASSSCPRAAARHHPARRSPTRRGCSSASRCTLVADELRTDDDGTWASRGRSGRDRASRSPASASIRSVGSRADRSPTWACTRCAPRSPKPATRRSRPRSAAPRTAGVAAGHKVLGALARTGMPIVDVEAGCASGGAALQLAAGAIRAGQYDCVLVFGVEKMPKGIIRSSFFEPWREEAGLAATPAYFALRAQRLLREPGSRRTTSREVVVKNRRHGVHNPNAMFRKEVTAEEVLASRLVCEPLHLWMLCSPNEGAAAIVLRRATTARPARGARSRRPGLRSHLPGQRARRGDAALGHRRHRHHAAVDARRARRVRGSRASGPTTSTSSSARTPTRPASCSRTQELGLCAPGEQARLLADGDVALGGAPAGQPERRSAVEGRTARRVGARSGRRARAPAPRRRRRRARSTARASGSPTPSGAAPTRACVIVTRVADAG